MPQLISMRATVAFDRKNGDRVQAGDVISVPPLEAAALRYQKKASFVSGAPAQPSPQRLLQRRDMEAENNGRSASSSNPSEETTATEGGRSRRHRRRDLEAGG